jgi:predicted nucleic acid-binding protein
MRTALDTSVILEVVTGDARFADASERALRRAGTEGALVVGECVLAEIRPAFAAGEIEEFLSDMNIEFVASSRESALLAGEMFLQHLSRRALRGAAKAKGAGRVAADFLIGAHAMLHADRLLARDRGYYREYFEKLMLMQP